jgi:hypothetical protein
MPFSEALARLYPGAREVAGFARWSREVLAPHGFVDRNALPLMGLCRDELLVAVQHVITDAWGPGFDLTSMAGQVFLGRSGLTTASAHAPLEDGRRRFVAFVMSHIGITADGEVGLVLRPGQREASPVCGALATLRDELAAAARQWPSGWTREGPPALDPDDLEMSLLRATLVPRMTEPLTDLVALTDLARRTATEELVRLADRYLSGPDTDFAVFSAVVVQGPGVDHIAVRDAWVRLGDGPAVPLS